MKEFILIFKTLFRNQNAPIAGEGKKQKFSKKTTLLLSVIPLEILFCVALVFVTMGVNSQIVIADLVNLILTATQTLILFTSLTSIVTTLYNAEDTPFLSSLPLKPTSIFFAKFTIVYINALELISAFAIPMILTVLITFAVMGRTLFYGIFPLLIVIAIVSPLLPLFLVTLFSMPAVYIGSYFKGRSVLKTVVYIILYMCIMCAYLVFIYSFNTMDISAENSVLSDTALRSFSTMSNILLPNKALIYFCMGIDAGINFGISAAFTVGFVVIMLCLSLIFYKKITIRRVEGKSTTVNKSSEFKKESVVWSLVKRDFYNIIRNPSLALSSIANTLLAPIFIILMYFITAQKQTGDQAVGELTAEMMSIGYIVMYSSIFLCGTNMLAILAYTREGKSFYLSKSLPISAKDSIHSKLLLACIVPEIILVLIMFIAIFLYKISILSTLFTFISMTIMLVGMNALSIHTDMKHGDVNWTTATEMKRATKANTGSIGTIFIAIIPGCLYMFIGTFLAEVAPKLGRTAIYAIFWSLVFVISIVIFAIGIYILKNKCEPLYDKIGENKTKIKAKSTAIRKNNGGFLN